MVRKKIVFIRHENPTRRKSTKFPENAGGRLVIGHHLLVLYFACKTHYRFHDETIAHILLNTYVYERQTVLLLTCGYKPHISRGRFNILS